MAEVIYCISIVAVSGDQMRIRGGIIGNIVCFLVGISVLCSKKEAPKVALTFDDGPNRIYTEQLLDGLKERGVPATFFLIGENITGREDLVLRMQEEGHLIGNHTYHHVKLDSVTDTDARSEIEKTNNRIFEITGEYPLYLRPPFGAWPENLELKVEMLPVLWDVDTLDWKNQDVSSILSIAKREVEDMSVILMHDGYASSVEAALKLVDYFKEKGYRFVTADQIILP